MCVCVRERERRKTEDTLSHAQLFTLQRSHWRQHFQNTSAIIFVVDSNDRNRIDESRDELAWLMSEDELKDCCVLVMANKQDLPNAMSINGIAERLGLKSFPSSRTWSELCLIFCVHFLQVSEVVPYSSK